ncbi:MAG: hypothetical protein A2Y15_02180 [Clostridiales bacterium GWF2_36_10]|nr:MAG: hypothetical protein A2Y15_02180 [Clostridiales bacterium GWF2_36_10]HAN21716.1 hypothetical protein [Clostridiales bacterium]
MKMLCLLLAILLITVQFFSACGDDTDESKSELLNLTSDFDEYFSSNKLVCWQDVAAAYLSKLQVGNYNFLTILEKKETLEDRAGYVITVALLGRQCNNVIANSLEDYKIEIKAVIETDYENKTVKEIALCFFAMTALNIDFNYEAAAKYIETLQNDDGGFPVSSEYTSSDVESSAYALNIITLARRYFSDNCYDSAVIYLSEKINNNNTLSDIEGKESAVATALTLNTLISAKLPLDGEVSTALTTAINTNFKSESNSELIGYKRYADEVSINREVTGEVFLCFAATAYGNLWTKLFTENNAD